MLKRDWSCRIPESSVGRPSFVTEFGLWDDDQIAKAHQIDADLDEVDLVRLVFCDPHGLARSKTLSTDAFRRVLRNGMDFSPGPFIFDTSHAIVVDFRAADPGLGIAEVAGAGDFVVLPDPNTYQRLPFLEPRTAWVMGDEFLRDGSPHPLSTRRVLREVCENYGEQDLAAVIGLEVEWYLTRLLDGPAGAAGKGFGQQGFAPTVETVNAGYQFNLDSYSDSVASVTGPLATMLLDLGLPLRTMEHESGPGQIEVTFDPLLALDAADAMLLFRTLVKQTCARRGFHASFMALPGLESFDPSGWHIHQSVVNIDSDRNVLADEHSSTPSDAGAAYVQGLLNRASDYCLLSIPTVNGYRRLAPEFALSPTDIGWGYEDRGVLVRVLGVGNTLHFENRLGEPSANPYLAIASQLAAGLTGMTQGLAGPLAGTAADQPAVGASGGVLPSTSKLPLSLREAVTIFSGSSHVEKLLGKPLKSCLTLMKESEATRFEKWRDAQDAPIDGVTDWEHREYFDTF